MNPGKEIVSSSYRLVLLGDLNGIVEYVPRSNVTDEFGVEHVNDHSRRMLDICIDKSCVCWEYEL